MEAQQAESSLSSDSSFAAASLSRPTSSAPRSPLFPASFSDASARQDAEPNWQGTSADEEDDEALLQRLLLEHGIVDPRSEKTSTSTEPPAASLSERAEQSGEDGEQRGEIERATLLMPLQPLTSVAEAVGGFQRVPIDPRKTREELDEEVEAAIAHFVPAQYRKSETPQRATGPETEEDAVDGQSEEASAVAASWRGTHTRTGRGARSTSHANARAHETPGVGGEIACAEEQTGAHDGRQDAGDPGVVSRRMTGRAQCLPAGGATDESTSIVAFHEGQEEPGYPCRAEYMGDEAFAQNVLGVECRPRVFGQLATAGQAARPGRPETVLGPHAVVSQRGDDEQEPEAELTPAQRFYRDNRDLLLKRAQAYYHEKQQKLARQTDSSEAASIDDDETEAVDDEWAFFREPVVRPSKDHLWGVGWQQPAESPETGQRRDKTIELQSGRMPTVEEFVTILQQEYMEDIRVIDLEACGRRDVARFAIIGTGRTPAHCRRVGRLLSRLMVELQVPFLSRAAYCHSNRDDDWVIARCAHIHLHLMTRAVRSEYRLEDLWLLPHEHFGPETFPGYFDCSYSHPPPYLLAARDSAAYSAATSRDLKAYESLMESQDYPDASVHYQIDAPARLSGEIAKHKAGDEKFSTSDVERLAPDKK
ncbi:conserved hypothetical protein [Neospora caninum Liverpool]|uniref:Oligomerization domain protein n=1 Tax=Neospora caninum (strain Liverpool) TaxID=572307 RepID=F0V8J6_NEOCL|nr:conserved hypothetical protein [Neospora caninum Liverpool]CBZ50037.1 conserved hypothetical protein [Neospora caninum Liverpool]|eukprot:XP_003880072.1 conserved hypothetical protein [Neospora caninum Liverpool]